MDKDKKPVFIVDGEEVRADGKPINAAKAEISGQSGELERLQRELADAKAAQEQLTNKTAARATQLQDDLDKTRDKLAKAEKEGRSFKVALDEFKMKAAQEKADADKQAAQEKAKAEASKTPPAEK